MTKFTNWLRKKVLAFLRIVDTSPGSITDRLSKYGIKTSIASIILDGKKIYEIWEKEKSL